MTRIKKIETPSNQNWMDGLKNVIEAKINSFIYSVEADFNDMKAYWKKGMEDLKKDMEGLKKGGVDLG